MKYLVIYVLIVFLLYVYLKYSCYKDKINILNINEINQQNLITSETVEPYSVLPFKSFKNNSYNDYEQDDYYYPFKKANEYYDNIKWKSFGTDISSKYVQQKKSEFREISTPNISIEKYDNYQKKNKIHFRDNLNLITQDDKSEIALSNLIVPKIIETYDNVSGKPKVKAFGLAMKKQFKSVNKLSKTFRSIRFKSDIQLPKEFNGPQIWKDYLAPVTDQGKCGNCWAHASSAVLADRFAILSLGKIKFVPSPYEMTICSFDFQNVDIKNVWKNKEELEKMDKRMHENRSCNGNNLYDTATTLFTDGVTELSCFPDKFKSGDKNVNIGETESTDNFPYCYSLTGIELDTCIDGKTPMKKYRCKTAYVCSKEDDDISLKERKLMYDIYKYGPVIVGYILFPDFVYDYDGKSIYTHSDKSGGEIGGHAVRLVGWGEETVNGELIKYWWIANSWGKDWGINGYFRMKRCMPEIQLEDNVMSIIPDFPGMTIDDPNLEAVETDKDKEIQNFTNHSLDKKTGYYNTSINKLKNCELRGKMFPYINSNFIQYLPNYKDFFAAKVSEHIQSKNINNIPYSNDIPEYYCEQDYKSTLENTENKAESKVENTETITNIQETNTENKVENTNIEPEKNIKYYICKFVNYTYFDLIYFLFSLSLGGLIYFLLYHDILIKDIKKVNDKLIVNKKTDDSINKLLNNSLLTVTTQNIQQSTPSTPSTPSISEIKTEIEK